jgi:predicted RNase H-like nuclease (RuvC/YqgF family)
VEKGSIVEVNCMGWGSAGTPPWVDEETIDEEKKKREGKAKEAAVTALEKENDVLKKQIAELQNEIKKLKK